MVKRRIGYARVSTDKQSCDTQIDALEKAKCHMVFVDEGVSATRAHREGLWQAKRNLFKGDVFVVCAIDRAFRSTIEAITFLDELMQRGVEFQSLTQHIDTRTPEGRKWFIDTASWAEYERAIISRRTKEKMAYARSQGKHIGRPYKISECRTRAVHRLIIEKHRNIDDMARLCRVIPSTLERNFERLGLKGHEMQEETTTAKAH